MQRKKKKLIARGKKYNSIPEISKEFNIPYTTLRRRINILKMSVDEAIN